MKVYNITVFEHQVLKVGTKGFTQKHFESLSKWLFKNQTTEDNSQYFSLVDHGLKFKSWVGILQIGNTYIEVLPKISNQNDSPEVRNEWRNRLCRMLCVTKALDIRQTENTNQSTFEHTLWEIFYRYYLSLVQDLIKSGLIKSYRHEEANRTALRGKLLFSKQITKNLIHQEKFYTDASVYNRDSLLNQVILKALKIISTSPLIFNDAKSILETFEDIQDIVSKKINWEKVELLKKERKTEKYQYALSFAELIIKGTNPDLNSGFYSVTGIMFDMNALFEKYVAQRMSHFFPNKIFAQKGRRFWETRLAIPDIIYKKNNNESIIFDTKWKKLTNKTDISSGDIFQQYVYCKLFSAKKAFLIYPWYANLDFGEVLFEESISDNDLEILRTSPYNVNDEDTSLGIIFWRWND
jgi:5-methylcytosine-specific restriction enzyme subunit McrC